MSWQPPRVQLLFPVRGKTHDGVVSAEAIKVRGRVRFTFAGLDVHGDGKPRMLLHGSEERMQEKKDDLTAKVQFKRYRRDA